MELKMYSIFDNKVNAYGAPLHFLNKKQVMDSLSKFFTDINNNEEIKVNPIDQELFELGTYDTETGKFTLHEAPIHMLNCSQLIKIPKPQTYNDTKKAIQMELNQKPKQESK